MISNELYQEMKKRCGEVGSWAVWDESKPQDPGIVDSCIHELHSNVVMVGLNVSNGINLSWKNFRPGQYVWATNYNVLKLVYAFNRSAFRGAYMTDLLKEHPEPNSAKITRWPEYDKKHNEAIEIFLKEMKLVGATKDTLYVLFGKQVAKAFREERLSHFQKKVELIHYSYWRMSLVSWVEYCWDQLFKYTTMQNTCKCRFEISDCMKKDLKDLTYTEAFKSSRA
jgi:hypothetical protein